MPAEDKTVMDNKTEKDKETYNTKINSPKDGKNIQDKRVLIVELKKTILWKKFGNELTLFDTQELTDFVEDHKAMIKKSIHVDTKIVMMLATMLNNQLSIRVKANNGVLTFKEINFVLTIVSKMQRALGEDFRKKVYTTKDKDLRKVADADITSVEREVVTVETAKAIANVFNEIMDKVEGAV
jgi:hypothetical protein